MAINKLYINGCSFLTDNRGYSGTHAGLELAKGLGVQALEYAMGGQGNDRIIAGTRQFFYLNESCKDDTFFLIGLSSASRKDCLQLRKHNTKLYDDGRYWRAIKYLDMAEIAKKEQRKLRRIDIMGTLRLHHLLNILALQEFFKSNGIKYCMYDALDNQWEGKGNWRSLFEKKVDTNAFFQFNRISHFEFVNDKPVDFVPKEHIDKELICGGEIKDKGLDRHPNALGHKLWAEELEKFIRKNNLL